MTSKRIQLKMWPSLQAHIWIWSTLFNLHFESQSQERPYQRLS